MIEGGNKKGLHEYIKYLMLNSDMNDSQEVHGWSDCQYLYVYFGPFIVWGIRSKMDDISLVTKEHSCVNWNFKMLK